MKMTLLKIPLLVKEWRILYTVYVVYIKNIN